MYLNLLVHVDEAWVREAGREERQSGLSWVRLLMYPNSLVDVVGGLAR